MRRGFTLVEVLVALVVLEVGLLGVVATALLASRTMARAESRERALLQAELLLDSLAGSTGGGSGERTGPWGTLEWERASSGRVVVEVRPGRGPAWQATSWTPSPTAGAG